MLHGKAALRLGTQEMRGLKFTCMLLNPVDPAALTCTAKAFEAPGSWILTHSDLGN